MLIQHINQLWKRRSHVNALLIFNAFQTLAENLLNDHGIFFHILIIRVEI